MDIIGSRWAILNASWHNRSRRSSGNATYSGSALIRRSFFRPIKKSLIHIQSPIAFQSVLMSMPRRHPKKDSASAAIRLHRSRKMKFFPIFFVNFLFSKRKLGSTQPFGFYPDIFPVDTRAFAGMKLQRETAFKHLGRWIDQINHTNTVDPCGDALTI